MFNQLEKLATLLGTKLSHKSWQEVYKKGRLSESLSFLKDKEELPKIWNVLELFKGRKCHFLDPQGVGFRHRKFRLNQRHCRGGVGS